MKKKRIIFTIIFIILILLTTLILIFNNLKANQTSIVEAKVVAIGSNYLLVTTETEEDYLVSTEDLDYNIGDYLKLELQDIKENTNVIEATAKSITVITENNNNEENINNQEEQTSSNDNQDKTDNQLQSEEKYNEEDIITYFNDLDTELATYDSDESLSQKLKSKFVKCIDFIFYDGKIGGTTFTELTSSAKLKILSITLSIDNKIDSKFPGYKETLSSTYQNIKTKTVEKYLDITTNICSNEPELCITAKEGFKDLKNNFGITWEVIKDLAGTGTEKLKNWYEIWRYN